MADWAPIADIATDVNSGKTSAVDNVKQSLDMINRTKDFDAIVSVTEDRALQRAKEIDAKPAGKKGRLAGVPFVAKDNFLVFGGKTTASANYLREFEAPYQATAIERLEAEGAICVAKGNLDAWAHGSSTENSDFFVTKNPFDKTRVPGGSSGGPAASVALKIAPFAVGTDTGSSVRLPASFCNVVGLKPTYGAVSRSGVVAMASSLDTIGPMATTTADAALVFDVMAGIDELDSTTIERDSEGYDIADSKLDLKNIQIGVIDEYMDKNIDDEVRIKIEEAVAKLKAAGAKISNISIPSMPASLAIYYIVCPAELASNLARFDGQRYGHSAKDAKNLDDSYTLSREQGFGSEAKRRIMIGSHVLSSGYFDAYYKKAQTVRTKLINEFDAALKKVDFVVGPVSPSLPFKIGEKTKDPLQMYLADLLMVASNLTGTPSISVPAGMVKGLPVGLQIIGKMRGDRQVLELAKAFEGLS